jgi:anti-sigma B factor antagonist
MMSVAVGEDRALEFEATARVVGGRMVAAVRGELDIATAPKLYDALSAVQAHLHPSLLETPLIVDMSRVTFVDATGLRSLVAVAAQGQRAGRDTVLRDPTPAALRLLDLTGLLGTFSIESGNPAFRDVA